MRRLFSGTKNLGRRVVGGLGCGSGCWCSVGISEQERLMLLMIILRIGRLAAADHPAVHSAVDGLKH